MTSGLRNDHRVHRRFCVIDNAQPIGSTIRIYLANGEADGVWVVEKSNWTGKALMAPRTRFAELRGREDLDGPGVYVLVGPTESGVPSQRVYIGETDDLPGRLDKHNKNKDFWNRAIVFTSKDANLNKAHIRYLESRLIAEAHRANRVDVQNLNTGSMPVLSEPDTAEAEAFLIEMLLIYPVLGLQAFQQPTDQQSGAGRLSLVGKDASATGAETPDGFVVHKGSLARTESVPSIHDLGLQLRDSLIAKGILADEGAQLRFTEDYEFTSPSTAAMVVLGRTSNGREEWKASDGRSLKDLQIAQSEESPNQ